MTSRAKLLPVVSGLGAGLLLAGVLAWGWVAEGAARVASEPTVMDTPRIVWQGGVEPSSALESHELVRVAHAAEVGWALAWNTGDFTIAQLADNVGRERIEHLAGIYAGQGNRVYLDPGPNPWQPIEIVEEFDDGGGVLLICEPYVGDGWFIRPDTDRGGELLLPEGQLIEVTIREEDGRLKYVSREQLMGVDRCDASGVAVGLFDPVPEIPDLPVTTTVRDPLPVDG